MGSCCNICKSTVCSCKLKIDSNKFTGLILDSFKKEPDDIDYESNIFEPELHIATGESKIRNVSSKNKESLPIESNPDACKNMEIIFQCEYCNEVFLSYDISLKHVKMLHIINNKNEFNCVKAREENKVEISIEPETFTCELCPKECVTKKILKYHIMHKHTEPTYKCTICDKKFSCQAHLTRHIKLHNKEYVYVCNYCGKGFYDKTGLDVHVRTSHTKDYPFHCTKCEKKFPSKNSLKIHNQTVHNNVYSFTCDICNKCFKTSSNFLRHKRMHVPKETRKQFKCNLCDASYLSCRGLKAHMLGHTGELKYECDLCNKRYKDKSGLKVHLLIHSGKKNCVCDVCGKAFALKSSLVSHCRIHTGERPFKCNVCQKTFTQKSSLNVHRKKSCSN
jgi:KRAB domain-containing zinc finger protein